MKRRSEPLAHPLTLHERAERTEAVIAEFRDKAFAWEGRANCIHLARAQMVAMGHMPGPVPRFRSALTARRALEKRGFGSVQAMMDSMLPAIPPAMMWVGDLALLPGAPLEALAVHAGDGWLIGWHEDGGMGMASFRPGKVHILAAWRL